MNRLSYYFLGGNIIFNSEIGFFPLSLSRQNWRPFLLSYVILTLESHSGGEYMMLESGGIRVIFLRGYIICFLIFHAAEN